MVPSVIEQQDFSAIVRGAALLRDDVLPTEAFLSQIAAICCHNSAKSIANLVPTF
jgi:hypothetical protein